MYRKWKWKYGGWIAATRTHIYVQSKRTSSHHVYQFRYTAAKYANQAYAPHIIKLCPPALKIIIDDASRTYNHPKIYIER